MNFLPNRFFFYFCKETMTHLKDNKGYGHSQNMYIPLIQGFLTLSTPTPPPPGGAAMSGDPGLSQLGAPSLQECYWLPEGGGQGCCPNSYNAQGPTVENCQTEDIDAAEAEG